MEGAYQHHHQEDTSKMLQPQTNAGTTTNSSPPSSPSIPKNTICMEHRRASNRKQAIAVTPPSPSRSWDELDCRPPSPSGSSLVSLSNYSSRKAAASARQQVFRRSHSNASSYEQQQDEGDSRNASTTHASSSAASVPRRSYSHEAETHHHDWKQQPRSGSPSSIASEPRSFRPEPFSIASVDVSSAPERTSPLLTPPDDASHATAALENAKRIIAALEQSNGLQTADWRRKCAAKDQEIQRLTHELQTTQRDRQALATECKQLQQDQTATAMEEQQRLRLSGRLEANLETVREAIVVLEATQDAAAVERVTGLLADSAEALREGIAVVQQQQQQQNGANETTTTMTSTTDPYRVFRELELQTKRVRGLELSLHEQEEHYRKYRAQMARDQARREEESNALVAEIRILRQQCTTNMEVLTKKERELAVLRDSLRVEDDVGYISDDEEEDDGMMEASRAATPPADPSLRISSPTQMEALATLLATGGNRSFESGSGIAVNGNYSGTLEQKFAKMQEEVVKARKESERAIRDLKVEKESLSNAKMIISSLERANKRMMEDLRARLHDSQGAVASLMEKSLESEKTNAKLQAELDSVRRTHNALGDEEMYRYNNYTNDDDNVGEFPVPPPLLLTETID